MKACPLHSLPIVSFLLSLVFWTSPLRSDVLKLDFNDDDAASPVQDGWTGIQGPAWEVTVDTISVAVTPLGSVTLDDRDRTNNGGGAEALLWRDFLFASGSDAEGDGLQLAITGLQPSTLYPITVWAFDKSTGGGLHTATWSASDGPAGSFAVKGQLSFNGTLAAPLTLAESNLNFQFTTDATGAITLRSLFTPGSVGTHAVFLNALRIGDPGAPTSISLTPVTVASGAPLGTVAGTLTSTSTLANDTFTYSLAAGEGDTDNASFTLGGTGNRELRVAADLAFMTGATLSIRVNVANSLNVTYEQVLTVRVLDDSDNDGLLDPWEFLHFPDLGLATLPAGDPDEDGSPNLREQSQGTNPTFADSDGDGLRDGAETGSGVYVSDADTGTDPLRLDSDNDGFTDDLEIPSQATTGLTQPGTDPNKADTDGDQYGDRYEIIHNTNPKDASEIPVPAGLLIDFSHGSNAALAQVVGPQIMNGYQTFTANHEIAGEVDREEIYTAFGTSVSLTVAFPDTTAATVRQLISRPATNNVNYAGEKLDLMRDWIGVDARAASGGNGTEVPTSMSFTLAGLPAGFYQYRSYHHDTEVQHPDFEVEISDTAGIRTLGPFTMTASTVNANNPTGFNPGVGEGPEMLASTVTTIVNSNGIEPVVVTYRSKQGATAFTSVLAVNGFDLTASAAPPAGGLRFTSVSRDAASGTLTLQWNGNAGQTYTIQKSETMAEWQTLGTSATGSYTDTPPANTPLRFYRVKP